MQEKKCKYCGSEWLGSPCRNCGSIHYVISQNLPTSVSDFSSESTYEHRDNSLGIHHIVGVLILMSILIYIAYSFFDSVSSTRSNETSYATGVDVGNIVEPETEIEDVSAPIFLTSLDYIYKDNAVKICDSRVTTANSGEKYSHYLYAEDRSMIVYKLDSAYDLSYTCYVNGETTTLNQINLYADQRLLEEIVIGGGDGPKDGTLSLPSDYTYLMFDFVNGNGAAELVVTLIPRDNTIESTCNESDAQMPMWLTKFDCLCKEHVYVSNSATDNLHGNISVRHSISKSGCSEMNSYIKYYLNGNYRTLTGIWGLNSNVCYPIDSQSYVAFYNDETNQLLFTTLVLDNNNRLPYDFEVDVTDVKILRIELIGGDTGECVLGDIRVS